MDTLIALRDVLSLISIAVRLSFDQHVPALPASVSVGLR
jgi:hypothetical protein